MKYAMDKNKIEYEVEKTIKKYKTRLILIGSDKVFDVIDSDFDKIIINNEIYCPNIDMKRKELRKQANKIYPMIACIALPFTSMITSGYNYAKLQGEYILDIYRK